LSRVTDPRFKTTPTEPAWAAQCARAEERRESKQSMASVLYQSIELLSQEKSIDPAIVVGAVEEAIALATRKFYKTQENMRGELNK